MGVFSSLRVIYDAVMDADNGRADNGTVRVAERALPDGTAIRLDTGGSGVVIVRIDGEVFALEDRCSHQDVRLSEGEVDDAARTIECWKHGSVFSLADGSPANLPATQPVPTYPVTVDGDEFVIDLEPNPLDQ